MHCTYRPLLVIIALIVTSIGWSDEPTASVPSPVWPPLEWKDAAPSPFARVESPMAIIDGKIYLFGGFTDDLQASNQVDVYDPASDSWTREKDMPTGVTHLNPASDGKTIWFAGGFKGRHPGPVTAEVWKYDIASHAWSTGPPLPEPRAGAGWRSWDANCITSVATGRIATRTPAITIVYQSRILIVGGRCNSSQPPRNVVNDLLAYDPQTNKWQVVGTMPEKLLAPAAAIISGRLVVTGGGLNNTRPLTAATRIAVLPID